MLGYASKDVMSKHIKFIGKFTDLKKIGYTFQKMYASDYMCCHKHTDPEGYGNSIWIWKKGNEVEFNDLYHLSYLILEAIRDKQISKHCGSYSWMINLINNSIVVYDESVHCEWHMMAVDGICLSNLGSEEEKEKVLIQINEWRETYYKTWRNVRVVPKFIEMVQELLDKNMIEICERVER